MLYFTNQAGPLLAVVMIWGGLGLAVIGIDRLLPARALLGTAGRSTVRAGV